MTSQINKEDVEEIQQQLVGILNDNPIDVDQTPQPISIDRRLLSDWELTLRVNLRRVSK
jgi:hypothetical protein